MYPPRARSQLPLALACNGTHVVAGAGVFVTMPMEFCSNLYYTIETTQHVSMYVCYMVYLKTPVYMHT